MKTRWPVVAVVFALVWNTEQTNWSLSLGRSAAAEESPAQSDKVSKCEQAVKDLEREFERGEVSMAELDTAREQLAEARCAAAKARGDKEAELTELKHIAALREAAVKRHEAMFHVGVVSAAEMDQAQDRLADARLRIAQAEGNRREVIKQLGNLVQGSAKQLVRTKHLYDCGMTAGSAVVAQDKQLQELKKRVAAAEAELDAAGKNGGK